METHLYRRNLGKIIQLSGNIRETTIKNKAVKREEEYDEEEGG